ncbi:MAG: class I SAM-dependent methyltransferase [Pseudomonadota bacterium]|nr:class I SAM-dependent methyltransferase [Pseudomonadota bacterium]
MSPGFSAANRINWDERVGVHKADATGAYRMAALRVGDNSLHPIEDRELGEVAGKRLIHLQCHFGRDTLALARRGAEVTGLDFSPEAIATARGLAAELNIRAQFIEGDVADARALVQGTFDIVYVTWGAINWLPDLAEWGRTVSSLLGPDGFLYLAEGHPFLYMLDERDPGLRPGYDYRSPPDSPIASDEETTYTSDPTRLRNTRNYSWNHSLSDVVMAIIGAGLRLEFLHEHHEIPWAFAPIMDEVPESNGMYRLPETFPRIPLSFSLRARKERQA